MSVSGCDDVILSFKGNQRNPQEPLFYAEYCTGINLLIIIIIQHALFTPVKIFWMVVLCVLLKLLLNTQMYLITHQFCLSLVPLIPLLRAICRVNITTGSASSDEKSCRYYSQEQYQIMHTAYNNRLEKPLHITVIPITNLLTNERIQILWGHLLTIQSGIGWACSTLQYL